MKFFNSTKVGLSDFEKLYKTDRLVYKPENTAQDATIVKLNQKVSLIFNILTYSLPFL